MSRAHFAPPVVGCPAIFRFGQSYWVQYQIGMVFDLRHMKIKLQLLQGLDQQ